MDVAGEATALRQRRPRRAGGAPTPRSCAGCARPGAVILGKTHVPELTITPWTESPTFGVTRNPWDPQRTPGGSSGGSGGAVAAGLCRRGARLRRRRLDPHPRRAAAGCSGSSRRTGRVPTAPAVEPWHGMSTWGPLTRGVADSALFYDAIKDGGPSFAEAAAREPGRLRIAVSRQDAAADRRAGRRRAARRRPARSPRRCAGSGTR